MLDDVHGSLVAMCLGIILSDAQGRIYTMIDCIQVKLHTLCTRLFLWTSDLKFWLPGKIHEVESTCLARERT